jgi:hypothetical protein
MKRKGENLLSPLSMKITSTEETPTSPSKEKKVGIEKMGMNRMILLTP